MPTYIILHLLAGGLAYLGMYLLEYFNIYKFKNPLLMVLFLGIAKEVHDLFYIEHTASLLDAVYTLTGGLIVYLIIRYLVNRNIFHKDGEKKCL